MSIMSSGTVATGDVALLVGHLVGHEALADGVPREDGPAGALQAQSGGGELRLEGLKRAEELVDGGAELTLGARGALGRSCWSRRWSGWCGHPG